MNTATVFPIRGNHSVKNVIFVCELASNLAAAEFELILAFYERSQNLKAAFPVKTEQRLGVSIHLPTGTGQPEVTTRNELGGLMFGRTAADGTQSWTIQVLPNAIIVGCNQYERWHGAVSFAVPLLTEILRQIPSLGVAVVGLQYHDEWTFACGDGDAAGPLIFAEGAGGIVSHRLMRDIGSWHSHTGWFERGANGLDKVLVNVNVNVNRDEITHRFSASLVHAQRSFVQTPFISQDDEQAKNFLDSHFEPMHGMNKALLGAMLSSAVQQQINLFAK